MNRVYCFGFSSPEGEAILENRRAKVELYEQIRREYEHGGGTIRAVARKLGVHRREVRKALASFCRKTYKLLINQEKPIIQDQTSDKLERRSGCGFPARRRSGESNCSLPSRSGLVGKLRVAGQRAEPPDWELNRKFSEGSDSGLSR